MCGIVGYIGERNCVPMLIEGLKRLEYRGYDSAGISVISRKKIKVIKKKGKVSVLESNIPTTLKANIGIAHTRWATHGEVSDINAHPHISQNKKFSIVHNGIIENYKEIKDYLNNHNITCVTNTDSEVIAHLLEKNYSGDFEKSFYETIKMIEGAYGIVAISEENPDYLMVARKGSPLTIGIGESEIFIASDVSGFLGYTKQVIYLNDYEIARIDKKNISAYDFRLTKIKKDINLIDWEISQMQKGKHEHYMLKEIFEQPESIERAYAGRLIENIGTTKLGGLNLTKQELLNLKRIKIIACGTSYHAGLVGSYVLEELSRINSNVEIASEIRYKNPIVETDALYFAVSQSGETADTLFAMREVQRKGAKVLGICNVVGSTIARESDGGVYVHSGPEIAVASTKAFTSQLIAFYLFSILIGRMRDLSFSKGQRLINELKLIPKKIKLILDKQDEIQQVAEKYYNKKYFLFLGRGISYPVALEGALKMKEITYLHSEGIPAGEIKHGPIALIDENTPVIFIAPKDNVYQKTLSNMEEVKTRGGKIIAICNELDTNMQKIADDIIVVPKTEDNFSPLLTVIPLQLLAYYVAKKLGRDIDQPRNLAKSVTVE